MTSNYQPQSSQQFRSVKKTSLISIESVITVASEVTVPYIRTESKIGYVNWVLREGESAWTKSSKHWKEATNVTCERSEKKPAI